MSFSKIISSKTELVASLKPLIPQKPRQMFFSSVTGEYTSETSEMLVPLTDEFVLNGYSIFEGLQIREGNIINFDSHYKRMLTGIEKTQIRNFEYSEDKIQMILDNMVSKSGFQECSLKFWISGSLEPEGKANFYAHLQEGLP